jgi:hypothetical protein
MVENKYVHISYLYIGRAHVCLRVLTEIWNNYIPKHAIFFGYHCVHTVLVYIHGIFGSANQIKGSLDATPSFGSSYDEYGSDTVAQNHIFPSNQLLPSFQMVIHFDFIFILLCI